jgi:hypothetical protein
VDDGSLLAREGTGALAANTRHGASCRPQVHRHGSTTSAHHRLGAAMLHPDVRAVMPVRPAPLVPPEGTDHHAGARHAATRVMAKWRQDHPHLKGIVTADRLRAHAPHLETRPDDGRHDRLGVQAGDHASRVEPGQAAAPAGPVPDDERHDRAAGVVHRCRLVKDLPRKASHADVSGNGLASWELGHPQVQHVSWVTDRRVRQRTVSHLRRGGRARWTIAHETCKTRNNQGDHVAHHEGHGPPHRAVVCATVMR